MKVGVVGAGMVGSAAANAIVLTGQASEVVLVDADAARAEAEAADIRHGAPFFHATRVQAAGFEGLEGCDIVIIAAGVSQKPGETRIDLLTRNVRVFQDIVPKIIGAAPNAILLVATNPVDIMTQVTTVLSGLPAARVFGSGTLLDTARFRSLLAGHFRISSKSVHAYVLGEHGDSEVLVWSSATAGGLPLELLSEQLSIPLTATNRDTIDIRVRNAAYEIIRGKGATWHGIGAGLARLVRAIRSDERVVMTVCAVENAFSGLGPVAFSRPRLLGKAGILADVAPTLTDEERTALRNSAALLHNIWLDLNREVQLTSG